MTEDESKAKWCPFARVRHQISGVVNRDVDEDWEQPNCLASACMAWRWTVSPEAAATYARMDLGPGYPTTKDGFCGLAGG